jgi:methionyl-tRNA formyltransferase
MPERTYLLVSEKTWHDNLFRAVSVIPARWVRIKDRSEFTVEHVTGINPDKIFIPHWSYIIPAAIYERYECIVFHMTDLPFGRGGSPLQNLIVRGFTTTKISAIRVTSEIDAGDIYLKNDLSLDGTASEIHLRAASIMKDMIEEIVHRNPEPTPQVGEVVIFKRRTPSEGNLESLQEIRDVYNYIRMLDCDGYPPAFLEIGNFRLEFDTARLVKDQTVIANVRITKK